MSSTKSAERWGEAGSRRNSVQGVGGGCCSRVRLKRRRGNFSTSSSSTRMLLHARRTRKLPSLSLAVCAGNAVKNRRLPQSDPSYRPARHAGYFFACFSSRGPPPLAEFPLSGRREWREEGFFGNGSMNCTEEEESLVLTRLVVDGYGRREVLIGFLRGA